MVVPSDERAAALLAPVRDTVDRALLALGSQQPISVRVAEIPGIYAVDAGEVVLSAGLLGPALHHVQEPVGPVPAVDRWRRAAACVLEAAALRRMSAVTHLPVGADWRWVGAAIFAADRAAPELALAEPELALAVSTGDPGSQPRAGLAVLRAWEALGLEPLDQVRYLLTGGVLSAEEWLRIGAWVLSSAGGAGSLPVPVARPVEVELPCELPAWTWRPLRIPAHPRGGRVEVAGDGAVDEPWVQGGAPATTLAGAASGPCRLSLSAGGPVGTWDVASAQGFGQVMGARGIRFVFQAEGPVQIVLADAFIGPLAAVAMAEQVGTSGVAECRWRVAGPSRLWFSSVQTRSLTLHGRAGDRFMVPARGFGMAEWLQALDQAPWIWQVTGDRLTLRGQMLGGEVEVRLKPG
jgi:hypothetical protein